MNNKVKKLIDIITKGVEITESEDNEQFFEKAIIEANNLATSFLQRDWLNLVDKLPIKKRQEYSKIKDKDLKSIITRDVAAHICMENGGILDVVVKNAPDEILTSVIEKMFKLIENEDDTYLFSIIYRSPEVVKKLSNAKVKERLKKLCLTRILFSPIEDKKLREQELSYLMEFKKEF